MIGCCYQTAKKFKSVFITLNKEDEITVKLHVDRLGNSTNKYCCSVKIDRQESNLPYYFLERIICRVNLCKRFLSYVDTFYEIFVHTK